MNELPKSLQRFNLQTGMWPSGGSGGGGGTNPSITNLSPSAGAVGTSVTITGTNFGSSQGSSTVTFAGTDASPTSWSATGIVAPVPAGAMNGNVVVTVSGASSNGVNFTVSTIGVSVSPQSVTLVANQTQQFTATVSGATDQDVTWTINPAVGSISSSGLYTAPSTISSGQTVTVTATSVADTSAAGSAIVGFGAGVYYYLEDGLGTSRVIADSSGNICFDADFYPYGGERDITTVCPQNYKFTGKERDSESNLDNFGARYNSSQMGRFMSPDQRRISIRDLINPQKWNKYAYTINNPLRYFDPDGMEEIEIQLRAFIAQKSVSVMGSTYAGDNRTFSTAANASSRTSITVRIETDPSVRANPIISVNSVAGQSAKLDANGNVISTATATAGLPTVNGTRDANGNVVLNFQQDTKNPLSPGPQALTPGISTDLSVTVPQNGSSITAAGTTSGFPSMELNVTPDGQPTTNLPLNNPGPNGSAWSLFGTNNFLVSHPLPPPPPPCAQDREQPCQ